MISFSINSRKRPTQLIIIYKKKIFLKLFSCVFSHQSFCERISFVKETRKLTNKTEKGPKVGFHPGPLDAVRLQCNIYLPSAKKT